MGVMWATISNRIVTVSLILKVTTESRLEREEESGMQTCDRRAFTQKKGRKSQMIFMQVSLLYYELQCRSVRFSSNPGPLSQAIHYPFTIYCSGLSTMKHTSFLTVRMNVEEDRALRRPPGTSLQTLLILVLQMNTPDDHSL